MKLLQQMDQKMVQLGMARSTRKTYSIHVEAYFRYLLKVFGTSTHPKDHGQTTIEQWLSAMAYDNHVSPTTQNVALQAVLFLYHRVLGIKIENVNALRSKKPTRMPTVLNLSELEVLFAQLSGNALLVAKLQTACGLRINEACSLRIKDFDFEREQMTIRYAKGAKDRITVFPKEIHQAVQKQMESIKPLWQLDQDKTMPGVSLPFAYRRKNPSAAKSWAWYYLFPSGNISKDPDSGIFARHHIDKDNVGRTMSAAARRAMIPKKFSSHALRHSFGSYMLATGTDIRDLAGMMGHNDVKTTMIYMHAVEYSGHVQSNPFAKLLANPAMAQAAKPSTLEFRRA